MKHIITLIAVLISTIGYAQSVEWTPLPYEEIIEIGDPGFERIYDMEISCTVANCKQCNKDRQWFDFDTLNVGNLDCRHSYVTEENPFVVLIPNPEREREAICRKCLMYVRQSNKSEFERLRQSIKK